MNPITLQNVLTVREQALLYKLLKSHNSKTSRSLLSQLPSRYGIAHALLTQRKMQAKRRKALRAYKLNFIGPLIPFGHPRILETWEHLT